MPRWPFESRLPGQVWIFWRESLHVLHLIEVQENVPKGLNTRPKSFLFLHLRQRVQESLHLQVASVKFASAHWRIRLQREGSQGLPRWAQRDRMSERIWIFWWKGMYVLQLDPLRNDVPKGSSPWPTIWLQMHPRWEIQKSLHLWANFTKFAGSNYGVRLQWVRIKRMPW